MKKTPAIGKERPYPVAGLPPKHQRPQRMLELYLAGKGRTVVPAGSKTILDALRDKLERQM